MIQQRAVAIECAEGHFEAHSRQNLDGDQRMYARVDRWKCDHVLIRRRWRTFAADCADRVEIGDAELALGEIFSPPDPVVHRGIIEHLGGIVTSDARVGVLPVASCDSRSDSW